MTLLRGFKRCCTAIRARTICRSVPVANRNRGELEKLIGFFVNILVMRNDLSANPHIVVLRRLERPP